MAGNRKRSRKSFVMVVGGVFAMGCTPTRTDNPPALNVIPGSRPPWTRTESP